MKEIKMTVQSHLDIMIDQAVSTNQNEDQDVLALLIELTRDRMNLLILGLE
jgi:hypothetical protein